jgi:hypothetical protein
MITYTKWFALAGALFMMSSLAACSSSQTGRTAPEATAAVKSVNGIADAQVEMRNYRSGFTSNWGVTIYFTPDSEFDELDKKALFERMLRIGWSVNEHKIDTGVSIALEDDDQQIDLVQMAEEAGLSDFRRAGNLTSRFNVPTRALQDEFGEWPSRD